MAGEKIRLVYELAEDMAKSFQKGAEALEETGQEMQNVASTLEGGALRGRAGEAFVEAIRGKLAPSLARLREKFLELDADVRAAIELMRGEDEKAAGTFGD